MRIGRDGLTGLIFVDVVGNVFFHDMVLDLIPGTDEVRIAFNLSLYHDEQSMQSKVPSSRDISSACAIASQ